MIETVDDEDKIVRLAFAEIIGYMKMEHHPYWFKFNPNHMKIHKIMYNAFESIGIPVTRSWYRYGCFIHSNQLAGFRDFSTLKHRYLSSKYPPTRLRSAVAEMGFDVLSMIDVLHETIDSMPQKMNQYLKSLYQNAPKEFGSTYLAKLGLHNALKESERINFQYVSVFQNWLKRVRKKLSIFHMSVFSHFEPNDIIQIVMNFALNVEEAILKIEELTLQEKRILKRRINLIHEFSGFFNEQIWVPFALEISAQTVTGFRKAEVRKQQCLKKKEKILESIDALKKQSTVLAENDLIMSWDNYRERFCRSHKDEDITKALSEIERIYDRSPECE